ncbi:hypothetical protein FBU30_009320 [Linnemannia zychae]|nr:hypothetical protein FBU30_009320 [Linnemannia zychae]
MAVNPRISEDLVRSAYDWDRLYHCLAKLSLPLRKLQVIFNPDSILTPVQPRQRMLELLPSNISEWSFSPADNIPKLLKELSAVHSSITTLELCIPQTWSTDSACKLGRFAKGMKLLHDYLCDSPNLVKLKCIRGAILLDEIDLFDRALYTNLNHDQSDNQISRIRQIERGPNGVPLNNENLQRFDISWIYSPKKHSAKRRNAIDQWKQELESERLLESTLSVLDDKGRKGHDAGMSETLGQVRYGELETSLQTLGLLSNVKAILESMDLSDFRGFPALEKLSFGGAFEQNPADEIERVFPLCYEIFR